MKDVVLVGDVFEKLRDIPDGFVDCVVTSPPYFGLRDYGVAGQIGLEPTVHGYVDKMVAVFREIKRVLKDEGTVWLNLGDSYATNNVSGATDDKMGWKDGNLSKGQGRAGMPKGLKPKDLVGVPWRVAFALQVDGWYLRQDIIWAKPNPMPESVRDRCTKAHEYIFMLTKKSRYYYDSDAIKESGTGNLSRPAGWATGKDHSAIGWATEQAQGRKDKQRGHSRRHAGFNDRWDAMPKVLQCKSRNKRSVWSVATFPFPEAHFATYPPELIRPCIKAGCPPEGIVLDPFFGSGTTGLVAKQEGRHYIGIELNPEYVGIAEKRLRPYNKQRMLTEVTQIPNGG